MKKSFLNIIIFFILISHLFFTQINATLNDEQQQDIGQTKGITEQFFETVDKIIYISTIEDWEEIEEEYLLTEGDLVLGGISIFFLTVLMIVIFNLSFIFIAYLIGHIYFAIVINKIAKKLHIKNRWMVWMPILQFIIFFKCANLNPWIIIFLFIPIVNIVFGIVILIYSWIKIAENRGFEPWYGALIILPGGGIFIPIYLAWAEPPKNKENKNHT